MCKSKRKNFFSKVPLKKLLYIIHRRDLDLDPDPQLEKILDPDLDPYEINTDPQP